MHRIHWLDQIEETHWVIISSVLRFKKNFHWPENLSRCECLILGRGGRSEYKTHRSKFNIYLHSRADGFDPLLSLHGLAHRNRLPFIRAPTNWVPSNSRILNQCENPMLIKLLTRTCLNIKGLWLPKPCLSPNESLFTLHLQIDGAPSRSIERHFYRTQVSLGSGLWVPASLCHSVRHFFETLLMWLWLMMIPTEYYWWCQYKAIPG